MDGWMREKQGKAAGLAAVIWQGRSWLGWALFICINKCTRRLEEVEKANL